MFHGPFNRKIWEIKGMSSPPNCNGMYASCCKSASQIDRIQFSEQWRDNTTYVAIHYCTEKYSCVCRCKQSDFRQLVWNRISAMPSALDISVLASEMCDSCDRWSFGGTGRGERLWRVLSTASPDHHCSRPSVALFSLAYLAGPIPALCSLILGSVGAPCCI